MKVKELKNIFEQTDNIEITTNNMCWVLPSGEEIYPEGFRLSIWDNEIRIGAYLIDDQWIDVDRHNDGYINEMDEIVSIFVQNLSSGEGEYKFVLQGRKVLSVDLEGWEVYNPDTDNDEYFPIVSTDFGYYRINTECDTPNLWRFIEEGDFEAQEAENERLRALVAEQREDAE